jgi:hypothetical protein
MFYSFNPFTGRRQLFRTAEARQASEDAMQGLAGLHGQILPECVLCDTREDHDAGEQRCIYLMARRTRLLRAGRYTGPISPFDLPGGHGMRAMFPEEYAEHCRRNEDDGPLDRATRLRRYAHQDATAPALSPALAAGEPAAGAAPSSSETEALSSASTAPDSTQAAFPNSRSSIGRTPWPATAQPVASPVDSPHLPRAYRRRNLSFAAQAARAADDSPPAGYSAPDSPPPAKRARS